MPKSPANDAAKSQTVAQQVLETFYDALAAKPELKDVADRFREETGRSDAAIRRVLFGDEA